MGVRPWWRGVLAPTPSNARKTKRLAFAAATVYLTVAVVLFVMGGDARRTGLWAVALQAPLIIGLGFLVERRKPASREEVGSDPEPGLWSRRERFEDRG